MNKKNQKSKHVRISIQEKERRKKVDEMLKRKGFDSRVMLWS